MVHKKMLACLPQLMSKFTFHLQYQSGQENAVANALSRAPVEVIADMHEEPMRLQGEDRFCRMAKKCVMKA
jgi:hypothetical protein